MENSYNGRKSTLNDKQVITLGVGAIVFKNDCVLLVERKNPPYANQWAVPGGKVHFGENLKTAVAREVKEETGIIIEALEPIYSFDIIGQLEDEPYHYVVIDFSANYISGELHARDDALSAAWVDRETFKQLPVNAITIDLLNDKYQYP
jgi:8-oxo-dGTP diphosphatase